MSAEMRVNGMSLSRESAGITTNFSIRTISGSGKVIRLEIESGNDSDLTLEVGILGFATDRSHTTFSFAKIQDAYRLSAGSDVLYLRPRGHPSGVWFGSQSAIPEDGWKLDHFPTAGTADAFLISWGDILIPARGSASVELWVGGNPAGEFSVVMTKEKLSLEVTSEVNCSLDVFVGGGAVVRSALAKADSEGRFAVSVQLRNPTKGTIEAGLSLAGRLEVESARRTEFGLQLGFTRAIAVNFEVLDPGGIAASALSMVPAGELESVIWAAPGVMREVTGDVAVALSWQKVVIASGMSVDLRFYVSVSPLKLPQDAVSPGGDGAEGLNVSVAARRRPRARASGRAFKRVGW
jgi:hypothetical protein